MKIWRSERRGGLGSVQSFAAVWGKQTTTAGVPVRGPAFARLARGVAR